MTPPPRRVPAVLLAALLAVLTVLLGSLPASAAPVPTDDPADAAAGWLAGQLVDGERFETVFDGVAYPDAGLTLDAVLAFAAAGSAKGTATAATTWVARPDVLPTYVGDGTAESYVGALAKLSLTAQVQGLDPAAFGGVDLLARLQARVQASGRLTDLSAYGDYSNSFSQSLSILSLDRAGVAVPPAAVAYLAGTECATGGFPLYFEQATCLPDPDSTAIAAQAFLAVGDTDAAAAAVSWLVSRQGTDGSFGGSGPTAGANSNSTGLAAQALRVAGRTAAADLAVRWLTARQSLCTAPAAQRGAIAYDASGFDAANAPRATAQAVLGLAGIGFAELDGTTASADLPVLDCAPAGTPTGTPTGSPTTSPTGSPTTSPTGSPTATGSPTRAPTTAAPTPPPTTPAGAPSATAPVANGGALPNTGADVLPVVWVGGVLLVGGVAGAVLFRRRPVRRTP